ncbi:MAG: LysR family transcriptional regulator [Halothiobacillus sp.]|jgi:DNA-binding transcriptional LysR family regulator|uniref:LysR family transcriptional regulator n=1 Tax=Halothiobacillus sp. TaxID=1891311 RepID=UPI002AD56BF9|nr:LysR family transcriptional regulator [Halothiobacillus sp.]MDA3876367.1 LysR family transcriptional regulator [Halothiobacillus sp.]
MADRRLKVFNTVARLLSFTKAAEALHMTQPAVTFQVRQLEEHFDTRLFDRTHNRVTLTDVGHVVYEISERMFELYDEMDRRVKEMTGEVGGSLNLGASMTIAENMLPALLGKFRVKHRDLAIRLKVGNTETVVAMVEHNVVDLAIVEGTVTNKNLLVETCRRDELVVIMPPDHVLADAAELGIEQLMPYDFICREEGSGTREIVLSYLVDQGYSEGWDVCMELGSPEAIKGAVQAGMGLSIMSSAGITKELKLGLLKAVPLKPRLFRDFSFVRQRHKFRLPAMEDLLEFSRDYCQRSSPMLDLELIQKATNGR